jgi:hypothetical protein
MVNCRNARPELILQLIREALAETEGFEPSIRLWSV